MKRRCWVIVEKGSSVIAGSRHFFESRHLAEAELSKNPARDELTIIELREVKPKPKWHSSAEKPGRVATNHRFSVYVLAQVEDGKKLVVGGLHQGGGWIDGKSGRRMSDVVRWRYIKPRDLYGWEEQL